MAGKPTYEELEQRIIELENDAILHQETEEELRLLNDKFSITFYGSPTATCITNLENGEFVDVNESFQQLSGYSRDELIGKTSVDLRFWPDREARKTLLPNLIKNRITLKDESPFRRKTGELRTGLFSGAITQIDSKPCILGMIIDITDIKKNQEELRRLRQLLSNIFDSMPSTLIGVDQEGLVSQWNLEAEKTTGVNSKEALGRVLTDVFPQLSGEMGMVQEAISEQKRKTEKKVSRQRDGKTSYEEVTVFPLISDGVDGAVIRVDDITERVRIEEMMIQSEKMLSVGGLAAGMAHEINNPLAGILQNVQVIMNRISGSMSKNKKIAQECGTTMNAIEAYMEKRDIFMMFDAVVESGKRAAKIVENMLSFSRKTDAQFNLHHLGELLDDTVELAEKDYDLKKKYDFRQIKIEREYNANVPKVFCEGSKIQQVFLNILKNGAQAMAEGKGRTSDDRQLKTEGESEISDPRLTLRVMPDGEMARIEIEDNGPGMDEATRKRAFEPFFTTKGVGIGTGLGLSVSYFIITENHGGTITVESTPGKGEKFIIRLPIQMNPVL